MIQLSTLLQQIEKELNAAIQAQNDAIIYQKLSAIKALCELVEDTSYSLSSPSDVAIPTTYNTMMTANQVVEEPILPKENLLDF